MNTVLSVRFELAKLINCCFNSVSNCKTTWHSVFRAVFKDSRRRPRIFVVVNLIVCVVNILAFSAKYKAGIQRHTERIPHWGFIGVSVLAWIMAIFLLYAVQKRKHTFCQVWCVVEVTIMFAYLYLTLSEEVHTGWPGRLLLIIGLLIKLHGLYMIYYFSLELQNSPHIHEDRNTGEDRLPIKYFVPPNMKPNLARRETDATSIASSPPSLTRDDNDSVLDDNSPTGEDFKFFGNEDHRLSGPQYSEIMVQCNNNLSVLDLDSSSPLPCSSKDNIIISDLMCGGSSTLNVELER